MPTPVTPPATIAARAELCEALEPVLASLHAELRLSAPKHPEAPAAEQALALAETLAGDVARLLAGEPALRYLKPLAIRHPCDRMSLLIAVAGLAAAVSAFRKRYHGWHNAERAFGWRLAGRRGEASIVRRLVPDRDVPRGGEPAQGAGRRPASNMPELRAKLAQRLAEMEERERGQRSAHARRERRRGQHRSEKQI